MVACAIKHMRGGAKFGFKLMHCEANGAVVPRDPAASSCAVSTGMVDSAHRPTHKFLQVRRHDSTLYRTSNDLGYEWHYLSSQRVVKGIAVAGGQVCRQPRGIQAEARDGETGGRRTSSIRPLGAPSIYVSNRGRNG